VNRAKLLRRVAVAILAFLCTWTFDPPSVQAETETWQIRSTYPYKVQIEFYSRNRKVAWPGSGRAYNLNDSSMHSFSLNCQFGERICYGAWDVSATQTGSQYSGRRYWGGGQNFSHPGCTECCWTCGLKGEPRAINLTP
jgi:hypothetical protein